MAIYLDLFDGATWTPASLGPIAAPLNALSAGADGTLWAVSDGKLWRRARGAAFTAVELPEGARVTGVDAPGDDMVRAWGPSGAKGQAIYRSRPFKEVLKLKEAKLSAYSTDCKTPSWSFTPSAPPRRRTTISRPRARRSRGTPSSRGPSSW